MAFITVDGQRIALLGPLDMEEYYDRCFQRDAYDWQSNTNETLGIRGCSLLPVGKPPE